MSDQKQNSHSPSKPDPCTALGFLIAAKRRQSGLTQSKLAESGGLSGLTICHWEQGKKLDSAISMLTLLRACGIEIDGSATKAVSLGKKIRRSRIRARKTQAELGATVGVGRFVLASWESGLSLERHLSRLSIFRRIGLQPSDLLDEDLEICKYVMDAIGSCAMPTDIECGVSRSQRPAPPSLRGRDSGADLIQILEGKATKTDVFFSDSVSAEIEGILTEHRERELLAKYGLSPTSRLLFCGPSGCGKTLAAHYISHELGLPIYLIRNSALLSSSLGEMLSNLQRAFEFANASPGILLLEGIDSLSRDRRDRNDVAGLSRSVHGLSEAMDKLGQKSLFIASINHRHLLDCSIWARFDKSIEIGFPTNEERERYIRYLLNGVRVEGEIWGIVDRLEAISYADTKRRVSGLLKQMILAGKDVLEVGDHSNAESCSVSPTSTSDTSAGSS